MHKICCSAWSRYPNFLSATFREIASRIVMKFVLIFWISVRLLLINPYSLSWMWRIYFLWHIITNSKTSSLCLRYFSSSPLLQKWNVCVQIWRYDQNFRLLFWHEHSQPSLIEVIPRVFGDHAVNDTNSILPNVIQNAIFRESVQICYLSGSSTSWKWQNYHLHKIYIQRKPSVAGRPYIRSCNMSQTTWRSQSSTCI